MVTNAGRGGQLPSVEDRGSTLNGTSYPAVSQHNAAPLQGACGAHSFSELYADQPAFVLF